MDIIIGNEQVSFELLNTIPRSKKWEFFHFWTASITKRNQFFGLYAYTYHNHYNSFHLNRLGAESRKTKSPV